MEAYTITIANQEGVVFSITDTTEDLDFLESTLCCFYGRHVSSDLFSRIEEGKAEIDTYDMPEKGFSGEYEEGMYFNIRKTNVDTPTYWFENLWDFIRFLK